MASTKKSLKLQKKLKSASRTYKKILSVTLILVGSALIFGASTTSLGLDLKHPFLKPKTQTAAQVFVPSKEPATLYIPKLSRTLAVSEGEVVNDRWSIAPSGVSYLKTSAAPGNVGNSVLYGHNRQNILGDLYLVKKGDNIYIVVKSGNIVKYEVTETKEVTPESVEILNSSADSRLTLYTCSGFLDSARFVVIAKQTNFI